MSSNHLIFYCPLLLLPSVFPSIRIFSSESALCIRWLKYGSFSISPSNEYPGLISFRIDWFDVCAVQGPLKSLFQHYSSKPSVLWHSAFFMVPLSHPYMTTGKTVALMYMGLCQQNYVFAFKYIVYFCHDFPSKEQASSNFMATVTTRSDFGGYSCCLFIGNIQFSSAAQSCLTL